jgi:hypothetical protein
MINLAGVKDCDKDIIQELAIAKIPHLRIGRRNNEVTSEYIGILNGFVFVRAWYYWIVSGYMPLKYADELYANYKDLQIRAGGHCGNVPPSEQVTSREHKKRCRDLFASMTLKELVEWEKTYSLKVEESDVKCVDHYHIDTQLGLCRFAEIIIENNIVTEFIND